MLVEVKADIFRQEQARELTRLINLAIYKGRYDIFVDISTIAEAVWNHFSPSDKEVLEERFERWVQEGSQRADLVVSEAGNSEFFALDEAIRYLDQPFKIVLENSLNDAYFLEALRRNFKNKSKKITRLKENGFLSYENAGGKNNLKNWVEAALRAFGSLPKSPERYLRLFVLVDSDRKFKGHSPSDLQALEKYLKEKSIPHHILEKREMENYLPDETFEKISGNRDYIRAYLNLTPEQKDYFDIQKGFDDHNRETPWGSKGEKNFTDKQKEAFKALYATVSDSDWTIFRKNNLQMPNFKVEFPKLFESKSVTQETLKKRVSHQDAPTELTDILDKISRAL